mmetsp:Transcript_8986/g.16204  ORF Transcript_8986/g.16204 Transcript_8986/m.16204 type:complete len:219 (-) Transcript_8986:232-888(-)
MSPSIPSTTAILSDTKRTGCWESALSSPWPSAYQRCTNCPLHARMTLPSLLAIIDRKVAPSTLKTCRIGTSGSMSLMHTVPSLDALITSTFGPRRTRATAFTILVWRSGKHVTVLVPSTPSRGHSQMFRSLPPLAAIWDSQSADRVSILPVWPVNACCRVSTSCSASRLHTFTFRSAPPDTTMFRSMLSRIAQIAVLCPWQLASIQHFTMSHTSIRPE